MFYNSSQYNKFLNYTFLLKNIFKMYKIYFYDTLKNTIKKYI